MGSLVYWQSCYRYGSLASRGDCPVHLSLKWKLQPTKTHTPQEQWDYLKRSFLVTFLVTSFPTASPDLYKFMVFLSSYHDRLQKIRLLDSIHHSLPWTMSVVEPKPSPEQFYLSCPFRLSTMSAKDCLRPSKPRLNQQCIECSWYCTKAALSYNWCRDASCSPPAVYDFTWPQCRFAISCEDVWDEFGQQFTYEDV